MGSGSDRDAPPDMGCLGPGTGYNTCRSISTYDSAQCMATDSVSRRETIGADGALSGGGGSGRERLLRRSNCSGPRSEYASPAPGDGVDHGAQAAVNSCRHRQSASESYIDRLSPSACEVSITN